MVSFDGQRSLDIVIEQPTVFELQVSDVQVENCLCQRFSGTRALGRREIRDAIFFYPYMNERLMNDQAIQGNSASPP